MEFLHAIHAFLAPEPLSPLFKKGGALYGWNEDVVLVVACIFGLFLLDVLIARPLIEPKARYFFLHACANAVVVVMAAPAVKRALWDDPLHCFSGPSDNMVANSAVCAIHLYHCLAFKLNASDIFHHVMFAAILCGLALPFKQEDGVGNLFGCFFLSGLPGGISYVLLTLKCHGIIDKMTEKRWSAWINVWIRGPSMTIYGFLGYLGWRMGTTGNVPEPFMFIVVVLHFYNGQHYCREAVESCATWTERNRQEEAKKKAK